MGSEPRNTQDLDAKDLDALGNISGEQRGLAKGVIALQDAKEGSWAGKRLVGKVAVEGVDSCFAEGEGLVDVRSRSVRRAQGMLL